MNKFTVLTKKIDTSFDSKLSNMVNKSDSQIDIMQKAFEKKLS